MLSTIAEFSSFALSALTKQVLLFGVCELVRFAVSKIRQVMRQYRLHERRCLLMLHFWCISDAIHFENRHIRSRTRCSIITVLFLDMHVCSPFNNIRSVLGAFSNPRGSGVGFLRSEAMLIENLDE